MYKSVEAVFFYHFSFVINFMMIFAQSCSLKLVYDITLQNQISKWRGFNEDLRAIQIVYGHSKRNAQLPS